MKEIADAMTKASGQPVVAVSTMHDQIQDRRTSVLPARIDGIDVSQLLRDIGEASVSSSPVDLFRLCLGAQRVLLQTQEAVGLPVPVGAKGKVQVGFNGDLP